MNKPIIWDVDTQCDFIEPWGSLVIQDAKLVTPAMKQVVDWARWSHVTHVASVDDHEMTDPEISEDPDYLETFPPHCMRDTRGARKIPETEQDIPTIFGHELAGESVFGTMTREILLLKKTFDVFSNPNVPDLIRRLDPSEVIVFGVATDICNNAAIMGLVLFGQKVAFVEDASQGIDQDRSGACMADWRAAGVRFTTSAEFGYENAL